MKINNYWLLAGLVGLVVMVVPLISALVTVTGAFGADPGERVNRVDFVWATVGLVVAIYCYYRARKLNSKA